MREYELMRMGSVLGYDARGTGECGMLGWRMRGIVLMVWCV
jgi:hypothetical protein